MSMANPIWGAPRIHGELLMLGIEVSQATVGRYMPWRPRVPSPTWRSFLHNHMHNMAAVDMFVVATATFRLIYALIVLGHDRRRIIHCQRLAQVDLAPGPNQISREAGKRRIVVTANVRGRDLGSFVADAQNQIEQKVKLPAATGSDGAARFEQLVSAAAAG